MPWSPVVQQSMQATLAAAGTVQGRFYKLTSVVFPATSMVITTVRPDVTSVPSRAADLQPSWILTVTARVTSGYIVTVPGIFHVLLLTGRGKSWIGEV